MVGMPLAFIQSVGIIIAELAVGLMTVVQALCVVRTVPNQKIHGFGTL